MKKNLQISEQDARKLYKTAAPEFKVMLESTFGEKFFNQDVLEILKDGDMDDCYDLTGRPKVSNISEIPEDLHKFIVEALYPNIVMHEAFNEGQKLSFLNKDQKKCYAWFDVNSSGGLVFGDARCNASVARSGDASRLAFFDEADARKAVEIAPQVFEDFLTK